MTGVGGRPEIVILGSNSTNDTWLVSTIFTSKRYDGHAFPVVNPRSPPSSSGVALRFKKIADNILELFILQGIQLSLQARKSITTSSIRR